MEKYYRFVGIFTTLSVDIHKDQTVYHMSFLKSTRIFLYDEELEAIKRAKCETCYGSFRNSTKFRRTKKFLEEIDVELIIKKLIIF